MKNKGFTLVELLAVIVVLGLIMMIAVPSTINVLEKNKKESYIADAKEIIRLVEREDTKNNSTYFTVNNKSVTGLGATNIKHADISVSPYDKEYKTILIRTCHYNSIRYYQIYMSDGTNQLFAVKGLPNTVSYEENGPINLNDSTATRYNMVKKENVNNYTSCYNFK